MKKNELSQGVRSDLYGEEVQPAPKPAEKKPVILNNRFLVARDERYLQNGKPGGYILARDLKNSLEAELHSRLPKPKGEREAARRRKQMERQKGKIK